MHRMKHRTSCLLPAKVHLFRSDPPCVKIFFKQLVRPKNPCVGACFGNRRFLSQSLVISPDDLPIGPLFCPQCPLMIYLPRFFEISNKVVDILPNPGYPRLPFMITGYLPNKRRSQFLGHFVLCRCAVTQTQ